ncbi:MAG: pyridoxamine 5'-phosphate oxidase family protein [Firmicutes bacterium]|nr:pyridoxamine 5'-phosphate oxidase family protein [Bacillota bacterium]MBR3260137.1 pyridoxamine 5'-phosphate oxidase family protein [Bacillota bacterium]MBR3375078.1 pyridoxamine 5'-phosphate oxidase family protein [Bacillota bacterium]
MRRKDREITDINEILELVAKTDVLHLGLFDGEYPYVVPLHYGYEYADGKLTFYMHGAKEGHKIDLINANPNVCVELENDVELIPGDVACAYGSSYFSIMGRGTASIVTDEEEKIKGLKLLMENQTGRAFEIDARMAAAVAVIKVTTDNFTAKARKKMPH